MSTRFGSPTPYDSIEGQNRKRRRYLSRSDKEILDEMDSTGLSYRAGWPKLLPLPLETKVDGVRAMIPDANQRLGDVQMILAAQGLLGSGCSYQFVFRLPQDDIDDHDHDSTDHLTLLFTADMVVDANKIQVAIMRIRSSFRQHESTKEIQIECLDYRAKRGLVSFAIHCDEYKIREDWSSAIPVLLSSLKPHEWLSLEVMRRGLTSNPKDCPPTIIITTPTAGDTKWAQTIIPSIKTDLFNIAVDFDIEILQGVSVTGGRKKYRATDTIGASSYDKDLRMGCSIAPSKDEFTSSTMGGSVTLDGGVQCGITNWHCVRDNRLDSIVSKTKERALEPGNKTLLNAPQMIESPSTFDHHGYLGLLQKLLKQYSSEAASGDEYSRSMHKETDAEFKKLDGMVRTVGCVYAGSGRRTTTANKYATDNKAGKSKEKNKSREPTFLFPLDWALVRLDDIQQRNMTNRLSKTRIPTTSTTSLSPDKLCSKWTVFDVNKEEVRGAKYGRTSGWSLGTINACIVIINPKEDDEISGAYNFTTEKPGACFGVVSRQARADFIEKGDSGSVLVHDGSGAQLGPLFGSTSAGEGMMLPMDLIFQDIKKITGKQVVNPSYVDPKTVGLASYQLAE
ncbi:hypothetical protein DDE83_001055 [Stemphylium lycopersici]|uniref:Uncharacterized protein n=1 Tax=Stemphylium lycopersici TaxID=183478 RepID=A0A364NE63_STELY|nr:hypothetical protein DDE83_001055 [Stemphylium lycopersici]